jgi:hypothetical protein
MLLDRPSILRIIEVVSLPILDPVPNNTTRYIDKILTFQRLTANLPQKTLNHLFPTCLMELAYRTVFQVETNNFPRDQVLLQFAINKQSFNLNEYMKIYNTCKIYLKLDFSGSSLLSSSTLQSQSHPLFGSSTSSLSNKPTLTANQESDVVDLLLFHYPSFSRLFSSSSSLKEEISLMIQNYSSLYIEKLPKSQQSFISVEKPKNLKLYSIVAFLLLLEFLQVCDFPRSLPLRHLCFLVPCFYLAFLLFIFR